MKPSARSCSPEPPQLGLHPFGAFAMLALPQPLYRGNLNDLLEFGRAPATPHDLQPQSRPAPLAVVRVVLAIEQILNDIGCVALTAHCRAVMFKCSPQGLLRFGREPPAGPQKQLRERALSNHRFGIQADRDQAALQLQIWSRECRPAATCLAARFL